MARPIKKGLDYFSLDVNFYNDIKIRKIVRHKGGEALSVYTVLLCIIYENGYYLEWSDDVSFLISEATGFEEDKVKENILYCVEIGLFDKDMFETHNVITSGSVQKRYFTICALTKRKVDTSSPFLLNNDGLDKDNSEKMAVSSERTPVNSKEMDDNTEKNGGNDGSNVVNSRKSTQRKVKESKAKHSSNADTRAREGELALMGFDNKTVFDGVDAEIAELRQSSIWKEQVFRRFKFLNANEQLFNDYLGRWGQEAKLSGKHHQNLGDAKHHFVSWMIIQEDKFNKQQREHGTDSNNGYRSSEDIYAGAARIMQELRAEGAASKRTLPVV